MNTLRPEELFMDAASTNASVIGQSLASGLTASHVDRISAPLGGSREFESGVSI